MGLLCSIASAWLIGAAVAAGFWPDREKPLATTLIIGLPVGLGLTSAWYFLTLCALGGACAASIWIESAILIAALFWLGKSIKGGSVRFRVESELAIAQYLGRSRSLRSGGKRYTRDYLSRRLGEPLGALRCME